MSRRRGQRALARAGWGPAPAGGPVLERLTELARLVQATLGSIAPGPELALAAGPGIAASTETPDRPAGPATRPIGAAESGSPGGDSIEPDPSMEAILARAQAGEAEAFGLLYDRYVDFVFRYIYYRVADRTVAEDLTSETFTRALRRITTFSWQGRDLGAWLVTIARNIVADHYKSARFRLEVPTADLLGAGADRPAAGPEGQVLDSLSNADLLDAVRQLGPEQQECVVLRFFEGLSVTETALAMDRTAGAVKALQFRAVRSLAKLLPPDFLG